MLLVLLIGLACRTTMVKRYLKPDSISVWNYAIRLGGVIALVRISILWYATYREWTGTQTLSLTPLLILLLPEGATIPPNWPPTALHVWLFGGLLAVGSFGFGLVVSLVVKASTLLREKSN